MRLFRWRRKQVPAEALVAGQPWMSSWGKVMDKQGNLLGLWVDKRPGDREDFRYILALCGVGDEKNGRVPFERIDPDLGYYIVPNNTNDKVGFFVMFACKDQSAAAGQNAVAHHQAPGE
jgi:hypothetical protein